jgi:hypothetical protein
MTCDRAKNVLVQIQSELGKRNCLRRLPLPVERIGLESSYINRAYMLRIYAIEGYPQTEPFFIGSCAQQEPSMPKGKREKSPIGFSEIDSGD